MRRPLAVLFVLLLVAPSAAAVPDARLAVSALSITPDTPAVGEPITVSATVRNSAGSDSAVELTEVRLLNRDGDTVLAAAENPGSLSAGDTLTVELTRAFETAGEKELAVVAVGEDSDGETVTVRRPLTVVVEQADPLVEFARSEPVAESENRLGVVVSNPNTEPYRNLVVRLDAPGATTDRRTVASLAGGASTTLNFSYVPDAGTATLSTEVTYLTDTGVERTTRYAERVTVEPLRADVGVAVTPASGGDDAAATVGGIQGILGGAGGDTLQQQGESEDTGPPDAVAVTVTNFGNAPVEDAVVVPRADDETLPRVAVGDLAPGESATVEVSLASLDGPATVTATVEYATGTRSETTTGSYEYAPPTGEIRLTGLDLAFDGGTLVVTGNAGNVGDGEVTGVVVSVGESDGVAPAYPSRDYFVGTVAASEFAPFELTADVDVGNATTVPVEVSYRVAGEQRTETVEVPVEGVERPEQEGTSVTAAVAGNPVIAGVLVLGVVVLAGGVALVARRER